MLFFDTSGYGYSKSRCEKVISWFIVNNLSRYNIDIHIHHRGLKRDDSYGWCSVYGSNSRPRRFDIELQSGMSPDLYIRTLLHELWHIYQHVKGTLKDKGGKRYWRGVNHSDTDYQDQPWEKEAYIMENKLVDNYMLYLVDNKLSL